MRDGEGFVFDGLKRSTTFPLHRATGKLTLGRKGKVVFVKKWRTQYMPHFQGNPVAPQGDPQAEAQYFKPEFAFFL